MNSNKYQVIMRGVDKPRQSQDRTALPSYQVPVDGRERCDVRMCMNAVARGIPT